MFSWQRDIPHQVPRFEFVRVNRFSAVMFGEALPQIVRGTNISLVGMSLASQEVDVVHGARLRLPDWNWWIVARFDSDVCVLPLLLVLRRALAFAKNRQQRASSP
jgi:hypothetical protein